MMRDKKQGRRTAQEAQQTKRFILEVAQRLFCETGYAQVSLRDISEQAGVSHSLLRYHFGSKEKIWCTISDQLHDYFQAYMRVLLEQQVDDLPANIRLYKLATGVLAHSLLDPRPTQLFSDTIRQDHALFDYFFDKTGETTLLITTLIDDFNHDFPDQFLRLEELKWYQCIYANSAATLRPFLFKTFDPQQRDLDTCLLAHWQLFNSLMAAMLFIPIEYQDHPKHLQDLIYEMENV